MARDRAALGAFLRARRDGLTPAQAGIDAFPGPRRVPGLRTEELAVLAGVSTDYYKRLERGRQANVSAQVLDALARALRLDDVETQHLHDLATPEERAPAATREAAQRADPGLLRMLRSLDHLPVLLLGRRTEILARNALLAEVLGDPLPPGSSLAHYLFRPLGRERIVNWEAFAMATVATLRRELGRHPHDRLLTDLVAELRADPQADAWWEDHGVRDYASVAKQIDHPVAGRMDFDIEIVSPPREPDQHLITYTVEPGSQSARALDLLAAWTAQRATA